MSKILRAPRLVGGDDGDHHCKDEERGAIGFREALSHVKHCCVPSDSDRSDHSGLGNGGRRDPQCTHDQDGPCDYCPPVLSQSRPGLSMISPAVANAESDRTCPLGCHPPGRVFCDGHYKLAQVGGGRRVKDEPYHEHKQPKRTSVSMLDINRLSVFPVVAIVSSFQNAQRDVSLPQCGRRTSATFYYVARHENCSQTTHC